MSLKRRRLRVDESDYKVGYGKPPRHSHFKPGQSGYPQGPAQGVTQLQDRSSRPR